LLAPFSCSCRNTLSPSAKRGDLHSAGYSTVAELVEWTVKDICAAVSQEFPAEEVHRACELHPPPTLHVCSSTRACGAAPSLLPRNSCHACPLSPVSVSVAWPVPSACAICLCPCSTVQAPHVLDLPAVASQSFALSRLELVAVHADIGGFCAALSRLCLSVPSPDAGVEPRCGAGKGARGWGAGNSGAWASEWRGQVRGAGQSGAGTSEGCGQVWGGGE
jgi:hypothetical protein